MSARRQATVLSDQVDDLLRTIWVCRSNDKTARALSDRLADVLLNQVFVDLRLMRAEGRIDDGEYFEETSTLLHQCRSAGVVPLSALDD